MKKYPKIVQCDKRGQIVIPKDIRKELDIEEGTGFWAFTVSDEGILLRKIERDELEGSTMIEKLKEKADKVPIKKESIEKTEKRYKRTKSEVMEEI